MTDDDALLLRPGDRIRLHIPPWDPNRPQRDTFVVARIERRAGATTPVRIVSEEGFRFVPSEVDWDDE